MTRSRSPEQWARKILRDFDRERGPHGRNLESALAAALTAEREARDAAVKAERERCAKIAESFGGIFNSKEDIAASIRSPGHSESTGQGGER